MGRTNMTMTWELVTPKKAEKWLENNEVNRKISVGTVESYAKDMKEGRWNEKSSTGIAFDENGRLRDGQHRLNAIIRADCAISMWVCRNVSETSIYDYNRRRTAADHIAIQRSGFEKIYRSTKYTGVANVIINKASQRKSSVFAIVEFTDNNKELLDGFFLHINQCSVAKISIVSVWCGMFFAYCAGVPIEKLMDFYEILRTGMSDDKKGFPVIAFRNYLLACHTTPRPTLSEISRCEYAIRNYLLGNGSKRSVAKDELIYPIPT